MLRTLLIPAFADVVFMPVWMEIAIVALLVSVVLLAVGLLIFFIVRACKRRKNPNGKKEEELK